MHVRFEAREFHADGALRPARYDIRGDAAHGWTVTRDSGSTLELGPGYRLLRTLECGVCSTDLARAFLPFPLPQVTGHELVAEDAAGVRYVVEINASHAARGVAHDCAFCENGLATHCPERLVLGIHDLPGGFGPWVLAPRGAAIGVPEGIPPRTAVLLEPFAAALNAVETVAPRDGDTIAVLGPRRLGMLVIAALDAWRARHGVGFRILALSRRQELLELARALGADEARVVDGVNPPVADVVVDTTGNPDALELALDLASREVHVKSTHGRPSAGLSHLTELVVDELSIEPFAPEAVAPRERVAWLSPNPPPASWSNAEIHIGASAARVLSDIESATEPGRIPRADVAVVAGEVGCDAAIRPRADREVSLVRPRGRILLDLDVQGSASPLEGAVRRGTRLSSSRCGDFRRALELVADSPSLRTLGERFVTHALPADRLGDAFDVARSRECIKAVVQHGPVDWPPA